MHEALDSISSMQLINWCWHMPVISAYSTQEIEEGGLNVQSHSQLHSSRSIWAIWDPISENKTKNIKVTIAYSWRNVAYAKSLRLDSVGICIKKVCRGRNREAMNMAGKCKKNVTSGGLENSRGYVWVTHFWSNFCCTPEGNIKLGYFFIVNICCACTLKLNFAWLSYFYICLLFLKYHFGIWIGP